MKTNTSKIIRNTILLFYILAFIFIIIVAQKPFYWLFITYLLLTIILFLIFRTIIIGFIGNYYYATNKYEKAKKYILKAIKKDTMQPTVYLNYAIMLIKEGDYQNSLLYLEKAKEKNNKSNTDKNISLTIGACYLSAKKYDKAIEELEHLKTSYANGRVNALRLLAFSYLKNNQLDKALENISLALEKDDHSEISHEILGIIHFEGNNLEESKKALQKALSINDKLSDCNYFMGLISEKEEDFEKAKIYYRKLNECSTSPLDYVNQHLIDLKRKKAEN